MAGLPVEFGGLAWFGEPSRRETASVWQWRLLADGRFARLIVYRAMSRTTRDRLLGRPGNAVERIVVEIADMIDVDDPVENLVFAGDGTPIGGDELPAWSELFTDVPHLPQTTALPGAGRRGEYGGHPPL